MPEVIVGVLAVLAGIAVLVVRYRRRDRAIAFMPLIPIGYGLVVIGVLVVLRVPTIAAVAVGAVILTARRVCGVTPRAMPVLGGWCGVPSRD